MGKGDIKSRKGKMANGSFGKRRLRNETRPRVAPAAALVAEPKAKPEKAKAKKAEK